MPGTRSRRSPAGRLLLTGLVAAVVVVVDQLSKSWAVHRLPGAPIHVLGPLDLAITVNRGSAFGLVQGSAPVVAGLAVLLVAVLLVAAGRARTTGTSIALGLLVGGALGNLIDRAVRGYHGGVVDFIDLHHWPTFNVADACITVGGVLLALMLWRVGPAQRPDEGPEVSDPSGAAATRPPGEDP